jgi:hypothetical protein
MDLILVLQIHNYNANQSQFLEPLHLLSLHK